MGKRAYSTRSNGSSSAWAIPTNSSTRRPRPSLILRRTFVPAINGYLPNQVIVPLKPGAKECRPRRMDLSQGELGGPAESTADEHEKKRAAICSPFPLLVKLTRLRLAEV